MRDPNRIPKILKRLEKLWKETPDLRLGQLIGNVYNSNFHSETPLYYVEDEDLMENLERSYKRWRKEK